MAKLQPIEIENKTSVSNPPAGNACVWFDINTRQLKVTHTNSGGTVVTCVLAG